MTGRRSALDPGDGDTDLRGAGALGCVEARTSWQLQGGEWPNWSICQLPACELVVHIANGAEVGLGQTASRQRFGVAATGGVGFGHPQRQGEFVGDEVHSLRQFKAVEMEERVFLYLLHDVLPQHGQLHKVLVQPAVVVCELQTKRAYRRI